jgi:DNA-directed RNA polymerase subunit RPC12/RpoP
LIDTQYRCGNCGHWWWFKGRGTVPPEPLPPAKKRPKKEGTAPFFEAFIVEYLSTSEEEITT